MHLTHSLEVIGKHAAPRLAKSRSIRLHDSVAICLKPVVDMQVFGPPDIERKVGLTGGHIFQGEILPQYSWEKRLAYSTPMQGVYLCGACTHPGGGVVAINGRNAAMAILHS
jgi:phytoene dehydrogenase-like protein